LIVETVTKKPLADLMDERVFQPLGMTRTSMVWSWRFKGDYANGYDEQKNSLGPQRRLRADSAGSMLTTPADFALFMQAVMQGHGLRKEIKDLMLSPQIQILAKHEFPPFSMETTDENKPIRLSYGLSGGVCIGRPTGRPSSRKATTTAGETTPFVSTMQELES